MNVRLPVSIFLLSLACLSLAAQNSGDRPRQEAKDLVDKAKREGNDRAAQVQDYCAAAQLEPRNKNLQETCSNNRSGLIQDDTAWLASAIAAYKTHDLERAESQAKLVSSYDPKLSGDARFLLERIRSEKLLSQVQAAWNRGDFQAVTSLAQGITNSDMKASANTYVNNVNLYKDYIEQAQRVAQSNPQQAIGQLNLAKSLNPNGPDNPAGMIAELQQAMQAKNTKNTQTPQTPPPRNEGDSAAEITRKVSKFLADAGNAEKQGDTQGAIGLYGAVLKLQPGNRDAQTSLDRLEQAIKNDPAAAKNALKSAIRYFYRSQFDDAQRALADYLKSPQTAQSPGVAYFYLGATLLEESILTTPASNWQGPSPDVQSAFTEARKASYKPVRTYVSPAVLKIWDSTGQ